MVGNPPPAPQAQTEPLSPPIPTSLAIAASHAEEGTSSGMPASGMSASGMPETESSANIASRLSRTAAERPDQLSVVAAHQGQWPHIRKYQTMSFRQLDRDSTAVAAGLQAMGVQPGDRMVLLVPPGVSFITLTFALFKAGAVTVLIDPGMGRQHLLKCLQDVRPEGFVAIPVVQAIRALQRWRFPRAKKNVTVGIRLFWRGPTFRQLVKTPPAHFRPVVSQPDDSAAIIFTTGSTGPPKGVLYRHGTFNAQVDQIRERYEIQPGGVDLAGFPLFGLFNAAMGITTVIPHMDASRPASVNPADIIRAVQDWKVDQSFASPAVWNKVGKYCHDHGIQLPTLRRVLSAGAPVPPRVLRWMSAVIAYDGQIHTPYGATESLPVATISAEEVLGETVARYEDGGGTCVGKRFSGIDWKVIQIVDGPLHAGSLPPESCGACSNGATISKSIPYQEMPQGEVGELIVRGPVVTDQYVTNTHHNRLAKISEGDTVWHRMGDVGYIDDQERFWFCGRKAHRVQTPEATMFTIPCEAIANGHPKVFRSALVGVGPANRQIPVMVCEPWPEDWPTETDAQHGLALDIAGRLARHWLTCRILPQHVLLHRSFPVDVRHNAKIFREQLAVWAAQQLAASLTSAALCKSESAS